MAGGWKITLPVALNDGRVTRHAGARTTQNRHRYAGLTLSKQEPHSDVQDVLRGRELLIDGVARPRPDVEHLVPPVEAAAVVATRNAVHLVTIEVARPSDYARLIVPSLFRCSTRSNYWFGRARCCIWRSSHFGTSWQSRIVPAVHGYASRPSIVFYGRGCLSDGMAGARRCMPFSPRLFSPGIGAAFACSGHGRVGIEQAGRECQLTSVR